jgi:hypothetical protein
MNRWLVPLVGIGLLLGAACGRQTVTQTNVRQTQPVAISSPTIAAPQTVEGERIDSSFKPKRGYVPDEQAAIAIAVAVWTPIYGKERIENEKPYHATLNHGVWSVTGSLPEGYDGGTAFAQIAQDDGRVLRVIHYQ